MISGYWIIKTGYLSSVSGFGIIITGYLIMITGYSISKKMCLPGTSPETICCWPENLELQTVTHKVFMPAISDLRFVNGVPPKKTVDWRPIAFKRGIQKRQSVSPFSPFHPAPCTAISHSGCCAARTAQWASKRAVAVVPIRICLEMLTSKTLIILHDFRAAKNKGPP